MTGQLAGSSRPGSLLRHGAEPIVVGHRGASSQAPENTLEAFRACWSAGVHWIEADVQPSADLVPVLLHDDTLDRTTTGTGRVRDLTLLELAALDAGSWFGGAAARIPTLHGLLSGLPAEGRVLLEIKGPHTAAELIAELAVIRATGTTAHVWLQSFETQVLRGLGEAIPGGWRGLLRTLIDPDPVAVCRELGAVSYNPEYRALLASPQSVQTLHQAGISVLVHTADEEADWVALIDVGVDGIITNRPAELARFLRGGPAGRA
jgi:glycerophosphoryl diester phosphodiesterase